MKHFNYPKTDLKAPSAIASTPTLVSNFGIYSFKTALTPSLIIVVLTASPAPLTNESIES